MLQYSQIFGTIEIVPQNMFLSKVKGSKNSVVYAREGGVNTTSYSAARARAERSGVSFKMGSSFVQDLRPIAKLQLVGDPGRSSKA